MPDANDGATVSGGAQPETIRRAVEADADAVADCVAKAYEPYVRRIGRRPGPMLQDYRQVIRDHEAYVALMGTQVHGVLVLWRTPEGFLLENVAVAPDAQGSGLGRRLIALAERRARAEGFDAVHLYTNEKMTESRALYERLGFEEYARRREHGLARVYMRKPLRGDGE